MPSAHADDRSNVELSLAQGIPSVNHPFSVSNLLPGDDESVDVQLRVAHADKLFVWLQADIYEDPAVLSRVLEVRVVDVASNAMIWQGSLDDLSEHPISVPVPASKGGETTLFWRIEAGLPAQAGNEYQLARCAADLHWYVQGDDQSKLIPLTSTGDNLRCALLALALAACAATLAIVAICRRRVTSDVSASVPTGAHAVVSAISSDGEDADSDAIPARRRGLLTCLAVIATLLLMAAAAWALIWSRTSLLQNVFETGSVTVQLNDGRPVFPEDAVSLEPGSTVVREFSVGNTGTADVFYRIYLENLQGSLASVLDVRVFRGETMLYQGSALGLERQDACASDKALAPGQTDVLRIEVRMADGSGSGCQGEDVSFDLCTQAVQAKNNEGRDFS